MYFPNFTNNFFYNLCRIKFRIVYETTQYESMLCDSFDYFRVRQIVCPVIPGTPKSVVGPLDILPGCSVGTLDLALAASVNVTAVVALSQIRDCVMLNKFNGCAKQAG